MLASDVQVEGSSDRDRLRFSLTAEGGLNDGAAFPVVLLGLGLLGLYDFGGGGWRFLALDVLWAIAGGLAIGGALGALIGKLVLYLRTRHQEAVGLDEFLALGLIAIAYGVAQLSLASGFLAVFAAGLALQRIKEHSKLGNPSTPAKVTIVLGTESEKGLATHSDHAGAYMIEAVQGFNGQLERLAEMALVMVAGAMLSYTYLPRHAIWFLLLLFVVARPVSVWLGLMGASSVSRDQRVLISWFGIRGVGSIFYLMYAINHGLPNELAELLIAITLTTVAASVLLHGISVTPLMGLYARRETAPAPVTRGSGLASGRPVARMVIRDARRLSTCPRGGHGRSRHCARTRFQARDFHSRPPGRRHRARAASTARTRSCCAAATTSSRSARTARTTTGRSPTG